MKILAIHTAHDAGLALFEDYDPVLVLKEERLNRVKQAEGFPVLCWEKMLKYCRPSEIDCVVFTHYSCKHSYRYFKNQPFYKYLGRAVREAFTGVPKQVHLCEEMKRTQKSESDLFDSAGYLRDLGFRPNVRFHWSNHHRNHALPLLFHNPSWENGLLYTADGGGDHLFYSIYHFNGSSLVEHYGGDAAIYEYNPGVCAASLGQMYCKITELAGFRPNRHEGKITGLAAFGQPSGLDRLRSAFFVDGEGIIRSNLSCQDEVNGMLEELHAEIGTENLAASGQKVLEEIIRESALKLLEGFETRNIGLSGGVFSNVRLNQIIGDLQGVDDMFVYPAMSDEGLPFGGVLDFLIQQYGMGEFLRQRRDMEHLYYGDIFSADDILKAAGDGFNIVCPANLAAEAAKRLHQGTAGAIFCLGMEYGPRALGARSILASPADASINTSLNQRLTRTEFMPFAPVVRKERLHEIFKISKSCIRPARYMTVTCDVQPEWKDKIPAVVHVDGTARPQWIERMDNALYYDILLEFEKISGLPCLINTSFNAHEEPIINTPEEALKALDDNRIDCLFTEAGIIENKK